MQRIIKFRAFNKASGIMYYPEATPGNYNHYLQVGTEGFWLYNKDGQLICSSEHGDVLMQYTGLKDKKGKEIYEGDIYTAERGYMPSRGYKKKGYPDRITVICIVEWSVYKAGLLGREVSPIKEHIEFSKNAPFDYLFTSLHGASDGNADWTEVIGNIHEQTHLLTPSQKGDVLHTMNTDPNLQPASEQNQEVAEQATTEQVAAVEQEAQEQAMESAEEGGAEG